MIVAKIAHDRLNPNAKAEADRLLAIAIDPASVTAKTADFVNAAHWADDVRNFPEFAAQADNHFIDQPFSLDDSPLPGDLPKPENIVKALQDNIAILKADNSSDEDRAQALRFVIHFVGDIHQPLHCATRVTAAFSEGDHGGNFFPLKMVGANGKSQIVKLHSYWDGGIGTFPKTGPNFQPPPLDAVTTAAADLVNKIPDTSVNLGNGSDFQAWAQESFGLAKDVAYVGVVESQPPSDAYNQAAVAVAEKRVVTAGYRLAALLNSIWTEQGALPGPKTVVLANPSKVVSNQAPSAVAKTLPSSSNTISAEAIQNHWLPDPRLTPGAVLAVGADAVCVSGYSKQVRNVPESEKKAVYAAYGLQPGVDPCPCEVDHLVSLELGGSNDKSNLWPQPYNGQWNAHQKDKLENFLHEQVCNGNLSLQEAQRLISTDWIKTYQAYGLDKN
jgi:hypothetical protein